MFEFIEQASASFMPHGGCYLWQPELVWTHVISDGLIGVAYFSIPIALAVFVRKREDLAFGWIFIMFAAFIMFCGATHFMQIWTTWHPFYWSEGLVKMATAIVSMATAVALWPLLPRALELPSPSRLQAEVDHRREAEQKLRDLNRELEEKVAVRTRRLEEQRRQFERLFENTQHAMVQVDEEGEIEVINKRAEELFGYDREELKGKEIEAIIPERFHPDHVKHRSEYMDEPEPRSMGRDLELYAMSNSGDEIPVEIGLTPIETEDGTSVIADIVDISQRKQAEQELKQFVYAASHDLREPARVIRTYVEFLEEDIEEDDMEKVAEDIESVSNSARRMTELIDSLLSLSRIGRESLEPSRVSAEECARQAEEHLTHAIDESGAEIKHEELPDIEADESLMVNLYQNLIGNAIKYSGDDSPEITLTVEKTGDDFVLGVKDNGLGIDPEKQETIFQPFKRLHGREDYEGTGIGLSICRKIVERHGGKIWVESEQREGAHFKFTVPSVEENKSS